MKRSKIVVTYPPPPPNFSSPIFKTFVTHPPNINELDTVVTATPVRRPWHPAKFGTCTCSDLENFISFVCNFHPALQFEYQISSSCLSFLNINLRITDNYISTSIFYKETDSHSYLHNDYSHNSKCITSIPFSELLRLRRRVWVIRKRWPLSSTPDLEFFKKGNKKSITKWRMSESRIRTRDPMISSPML